MATETQARVACVLTVRSARGSGSRATVAQSCSSSPRTYQLGPPVFPRELSAEGPSGTHAKKSRDTWDRRQPESQANGWGVGGGMGWDGMGRDGMEWNPSSCGRAKRPTSHRAFAQPSCHGRVMYKRSTHT